MGNVALFRALHFESTTLVVQSFKDMVTQGDVEGTPSKRVPVPEKRARLAEQRKRLGGLTIKGETEPSWQLIDACNSIYEGGTMIYIPPRKCTKRDDEVALGSKDRGQAIQVEGAVLKVGAEPLKHECDTGTELKLLWAFTRRAVAMDNCCLLTYDVQQAWIQKLMDSIAAPAPPGYAKVTTSQVVRADHELWLPIAREVPGPYKVDAAGKSPLDAEFEKFMYDPRVTQFLLPLPKAVSHAHHEHQDPSRTPPPPTATAERPPKNPKKGKGKGKDKPPRNLPEQFKGLATRTEKGNICFALNLEGGCNNQTRKVPHGIRCDRGLHVCIRCHMAGHSLLTCRKGGA